MYHGTGKGGVKKPEDLKPDLGGPSKPTRQKMKGGYTNTSGVLNSLRSMAVFCRAGRLPGFEGFFTVAPFTSF